MGYCDDEEEDEGLIDEAIVHLDELECALLAGLLHESAGGLVGEVAHHLDAIDSTVVHITLLEFKSILPY